MQGKRQRKPGVWDHLNAPKSLKGWRASTGMSQREAAEHIGIDAAKYSGFETGHKRPSIDHAALIERVTGVRVIDWAQSTVRIRRAKSALRDRAAQRRAAVAQRAA